MIILHTKDRCPTCLRVKNFLDSCGVTYIETGITDDVVAWAKRQGIYSAPIVESDDEALTHGGFNLELLAKLVNKER